MVGAVLLVAAGAVQLVEVAAGVVQLVAGAGSTAGGGNGRAVLLLVATGAVQLVVVTVVAVLVQLAARDRGQHCI